MKCTHHDFKLPLWTLVWSRVLVARKAPLAGYKHPLESPGAGTKLNIKTEQRHFMIIIDAKRALEDVFDILLLLTYRYSLFSATIP